MCTSASWHSSPPGGQRTRADAAGPQRPDTGFPAKTRCLKPRSSGRWPHLTSSTYSCIVACFFTLTHVHTFRLSQTHTCTLTNTHTRTEAPRGQDFVPSPQHRGRVDRLLRTHPDTQVMVSVRGR